MMAHLKARPVSLVRAPDGITGQLFFQKRLDKANMPGIKPLAPELDPDHAPLLEVAKPEGLLAAGNNPWQSYSTAAQSLSVAMKVMGFTSSVGQ